MAVCGFDGCLRQFQPGQAMNAHREAFHGGRNAGLKCRYGCERTFKTKAAMDVHRDAFHRSGSGSGNGNGTAVANEKLICGYNKCQRQFNDADALAWHRHQVHVVPGAPPPPPPRHFAASCSDCNRNFASVDALRVHQLSTPDHFRLSLSVGSLGCSECRRSFRSNDCLEQHFVEDHLLKFLPKGPASAQQERDLIKDWKKPETSVSRVLSVFKIYNPTWRVRKFNLRKAAAQDKDNVVTRYHGTSLLCDLGNGNKSKLCADSQCRLCSILRTGFKVAKATTGWQRFGPGIYTTQTSGKANDYVKSSSKRRAVLVCKVVAGKVYRTQLNMPDISGPPDGYDSVSGEVGLHLNYDETVVYQSKAVLPMYMIVYELR